MVTTPAASFLSARWRWLVMLNFAIDPAVLKPLVPDGTELDDWQGTTFVSLVAFQFLETKLKGVPVPFHRNFEEINLRFYVRRKGPEGWRRGVVFVREVVPKRAIALVARRVYNEPYVACPTGSTVVEPAAGQAGRVSYRWQAEQGWLTVDATFGGEPRLPPDEAQETFITEHYWGYTRQRDSSTIEYQVEHPRWRVWQAEKTTMSGDFADFYGESFAPALAADPVSAFVADGSPVIVRSGVRLDPSR